jgi:Tol biopolymer transport system component
MNVPPELNDPLVDWLEEGPTRASDQVLSVVVHAFPSIPQRRAPRGVRWRSRTVHAYFRVLAAAAAALVILTGGVVLLPQAQSPGATPSPSPSPSCFGACTPVSELTIVYERHNEAGWGGLGLVQPGQPIDRTLWINDVGAGVANPVWSVDGQRIAYFDGRTNMESWRKPDGTDPQPLTVDCTPPCADESGLSFSPDGTSTVAERIYGTEQTPTSTGITIGDLATNTARQITSVPWDTGEDKWPRWSPDGQHIVFYRVERSDADHMTGSGVWSVRPDGSDLQRLTPEGQVFGDPDWSPDGRTIVLDSGPIEEYPAGGQGLYSMGPDGSDLVPILISTGVDAGASPLPWASGQPSGTPGRMTGAAGPRWMPDGRSIVFTLLGSGGAAAFQTGELFAIPSEGGAPTRVSDPEGDQQIHPAIRPLMESTDSGVPTASP